jgi:DNA-binding transcriptional regulator YhcF (GntR family)
VVVNLLIDVQSEVPIYLQITRNLEEEILMGVYPEEEQIPSTTELSVGLKINPATVLKGMNQLVQDGVIYKKRGLGMFVCSGAVEKLRSRRQNEFYEKYVIPLMSEGQRLGIAPGQIIAMIEKGCDKT